jgi:DNA-binding transcriptional LysR family regulator
MGASNVEVLGKIEVFLEVAKQRSFARAARSLGMTGAAVSKQVMALEAGLGVKLLNRTTRTVALTDEGALYAEKARLALDELKDAAAQLQDMKRTPAGTLKIGAPLSFSHMHLLPILSGFARRYPDMVLDISLEDRVVDVIAEGFDVVIRVSALHDSSLIYRPLASCPILLVASPTYLASRGMPAKPADLKRHRIVLYTTHGAGMEWRYRGPDGKTGSVQFDGAFKANTAEMMVQASLDDIGISLLPIFSVATYLRSGQLIRVMPEYETYPPREIVALMPPSRYRTAKVKLFIDWLAQACKALPWQTATSSASEALEA